MRFLARVLLFTAMAALISTSPLWAQADERTVYAAVLDDSGAPVPGLSANEFIVREDGLAREVLRVSPATEPLQIALLIDTSQAIEPHVANLRTGLRAFFKEVGGKHEIALIGTGDRPTVLTDYTRDSERLEKALGNVFGSMGSGTYLLDAIISAADALRRRKAPRPTIVSITAQGPEFSERHYDYVLEQLRESGATLHSLVLTSPRALSANADDQDLGRSLGEGTDKTGGRRDDLLTSMALTDRLQVLGRELNGQYRITYARPRTLLPPKAMEVAVKRPGLTARARRWP
jgi:VWFA-related protein